MAKQRTNNPPAEPNAEPWFDRPTTDLRDDAENACEILYNDLARLGGFLGSIGIGQKDHTPAETRRMLAGWSRRVAQSAANINVSIGLLLTRLDNG